MSKNAIINNWPFDNIYIFNICITEIDKIRNIFKNCIYKLIKSMYNLNVFICSAAAIRLQLLFFIF